MLLDQSCGMRILVCNFGIGMREEVMKKGLCDFFLDKLNYGLNFEKIRREIC